MITRPDANRATASLLRRSMAALVAMALIAAACGDDDEADTAASGGDSAPTAASEPAEDASEDASASGSEPAEDASEDTSASGSEPAESMADLSIDDSFEVTGFPALDPAPTMFELIEDRGDTLLVKHRFGEVEIPADPQRIYSDASMLPTAIELDLNWVGAEYYADSVGLPNWSDVSADAEFLNEATYQTNFEAVAALRPDLILAYGEIFWSGADADDHYALLSEIAPTLVPSGDPVAYFQTLARELGIALGTDEAEMTSVVTAKTQELVDACAPLREAIGDETVVMLGINGTHPQLNGAVTAFDGPVTPQADTRWLYDFCGFEPGANLFELVGTGFTLDISEELLPSIDADHLFVHTSGYTPEEREASAELLGNLIGSEIWNAIPAVQNGNVYVYEYFSSLSFDTASAAIASANDAFAAAG